MKTLVRVLSVTMAVITMLIASVMPVSAATKSYSNSLYDSLGNYIYTTLVFTGTADTGIDVIGVGGNLRTGDQLPAVDGDVYYMAVGGISYDETTTYLTRYGSLKIADLKENTWYNVNLVTGQCTGHIYVDKTMTPRQVYGRTMLSEELSLALTDMVSDLNCQVRQNPNYVEF